MTLEWKLLLVLEGQLLMWCLVYRFRSFPFKNFQDIERLTYTKAKVINKITYYLIVPPVPPNHLRFFGICFKCNVIKSLTIFSVDSNTIFSYERLPTTFSYKLPTPFNVLRIAPRIAFMVELAPCSINQDLVNPQQRISFSVIHLEDLQFMCSIANV